MPGGQFHQRSGPCDENFIRLPPTENSIEHQGKVRPVRFLPADRKELMDLNPSAARSLGEEMEETLTVHRLHLRMQLRKTMAGTNVIESAFSIVEQVCGNVKRRHGGRASASAGPTLGFWPPKSNSAECRDTSRFRCSSGVEVVKGRKAS